MAKINVDSLVSALSHEKVLDTLGKIIQSSLDATLSHRLDILSQAMEALQIEVKQKNDHIQTLTKQNTELKIKIENQNLHIEQLEAYNRQENLVIQGLPLSYAQAVGGANADGTDDEITEHSSDTEIKFLTFCDKQLGITVEPSDISICHRLRKSAKQQYPPIIVRFTNRKARNMVLNARKKLKNAEHPVFINEHLTRSAATLFATARKLAKDGKVSRVWTKNGQVMVKSLADEIMHINAQTDLNQF